MNKLSLEVTAEYKDMKSVIWRELKLSATTYLEKFNTCGKATDETYMAYAFKLRGFHNYYLKSRNVRDFDRLCELSVCDRIKTTLSERRLKYILSIESILSRDKIYDGWLTV